MSTRLAKSVGAAADVFRLWHAKDAEDVDELIYPLEDFQLFRAGIGDNILYASDKWEDDGEVYDYTHPFDSGPSVYTVDGDGEEANLAELLGVREVSARAVEPFPILAAVKELIIEHDDGSKRALRFGAKRDIPMLLCTLDKKGLIILTNDMGPIIVRGGKMHVEDRGICR